jgi:hypothetical protein
MDVIAHQHDGSARISIHERFTAYSPDALKGFAQSPVLILLRPEDPILTT